MIVAVSSSSSLPRRRSRWTGPVATGLALCALLACGGEPARRAKQPALEPAAPAAIATPAAPPPPAAPAPEPAPAPAEAPAEARAPMQPPPPGKWDSAQKLSATLDGAKASGQVLVYLPSRYGEDPSRRYPLVIALHGWNHTPAMLRDKSDLEQLADRYGLVLALPQMGKTVYETQFYPQSTRKWAGVPGTRWVGEVVLPELRKRYAVYADRAHTAVVGYSTGGRGAVLLAEAYPEFAFAGSLSGTFDLMRLDPADGEYKIHAVIYGPRDKFKERWELDNCIAPARLAKLAGTRLYLGHGDKDKVVKPDQLTALADALKAHPELEAEVVSGPGAQHDWEYWNSGWAPMFAKLALALGR